MEILFLWELHEVTSESINLIGVKFRGTLRKFAIEQNINLLVENASDKKNCVRFAIISNDNESMIRYKKISSFLDEKFGNNITRKPVEGLGYLENPVLSKIDVNNTDRY
ncbi:MAG: hypothetical protein KBB75_00005 [Candidatus Pacebacteria bacterium]|jgi:predicted transcriptional regulator|nr:hypothetical protein [Candidatus Paceibacterota bacterium]